MGWHSDGIGKIYYVEKNYRFGEVVAIGAHPSSAASGMVNTSSKIGYASEEYEEMWCLKSTPYCYEQNEIQQKRNVNHP